MLELNGVSCGDQFTAAATLSDVIGSSGGYFAVSGNDVFVALQYHPSGSQGQPVWTREAHAPIGNGVLAPGTTGVRFRNYVAGSVGVVSASLSEKAEPPITLIAGGSASPVSASPFIGSAKNTTNVTTTGTTFATGADLTSAISFTADGLSDYLLLVGASIWQGVAGIIPLLNINLDNTDDGRIAQNNNTPAQPVTLSAIGVLPIPSAGHHTVTARLICNSAGTVEVFGGAGGVGNFAPITVSLWRLS